MLTFKFHPGQTFDEVRRMVAQLNGTEHRNDVAKLTWRDGTAKDQTVVYLYDAMAERFGHKIDKESIAMEIFNSLIIGIPVDVTVSAKRKEDLDA